MLQLSGFILVVRPSVGTVDLCVKLYSHLKQGNKGGKETLLRYCKLPHIVTTC